MEWVSVIRQFQLPASRQLPCRRNLPRLKPVTEQTWITPSRVGSHKVHAHGQLSVRKRHVPLRGPLLLAAIASNSARPLAFLWAPGAREGLISRLRSHLRRNSRQHVDGRGGPESGHPAVSANDEPKDRDAERGSDPGESGDKSMSKVKAAGCRGQVRDHQACRRQAGLGLWVPQLRRWRANDRNAVDERPRFAGVADGRGH